MGLLDELRATGGDLDAIVDVCLPGTSSAQEMLRKQVVALCRDLTATGALILGPAGTGKSTLARVVALGRYLDRIRATEAQKFMDSLRLEGVARLSVRSLDWYEELPLTGLVHGLADSQLFGIAERTATGVSGRPGIFQQAMNGHQQGGRASKAAEITRGVVFLDEVGDLPAVLQPKLLAVLSGSAVSPVGGEGNREAAYSFGGLALAASWKPLDSETIRPDLYARLSSHVLRVPSLNDRRKDIRGLTEWVARGMLEEAKNSVRAMVSNGAGAVDEARLASRVPESLNFTPGDYDLLTNLDWGSHGELRGLSQVIGRVLRGVDVPSAIEMHVPQPQAHEDQVELAEALIERAVAVPPSGNLSKHFRGVELAVRGEVVSRLKADPASLRRLADHLGIEVSRLKKQIQDFSRSRRAS